MARQILNEIQHENTMVRAPFVSLNNRGVVTYSFRDLGKTSKKTGWERLIQDLRLGVSARINSRQFR